MRLIRAMLTFAILSLALLQLASVPFGQDLGSVILTIAAALVYLSKTTKGGMAA